MQCTIPYDAPDRWLHYLTVEVLYDVIATGGPLPPFDIRLRDVVVMDCYRVIPHPSGERIETVEEDHSALADYAKKYVAEHREWYLECCRKNEFDFGEIYGMIE